MKLRVNITYIFLYLMCFLIIYLSGSVLSAIDSTSFLYRALLTIMMVILVYFSFLFIVRYGIPKNFIFCTFGAGIYLLFETMIYPDAFSTFLNRIVWFLMFWCLTAYLGRNENFEIGHILYQVIVFIALYTMAFWLLNNIVHVNFPHIMEYQNDSFLSGLRYKNYAYVYYENPTTIMTFAGHSIQRLSGFFWEAGVYQIYLNYALYRYLFYEQQNNKILVVLLLNLILSFSTTGWILAVYLFIMKAMFNKRVSNNSRVVIVIPAIVLMIGVFVSMISIKGNLSSTGLISKSLRFSDISFGLQLFIEHPIWGTGFTNVEPFKALQGLSRGNSNGLITWLFTMGVIGIIVVAAPFVKNLKMSDNREYKDKLIVYIMFLIITNMTEPVYTLPFIVLLLAEQYSLVYLRKVKSLQ